MSMEQFLFHLGHPLLMQVLPDLLKIALGLSVYLPGKVSVGGDRVSHGTIRILRGKGNADQNHSQSQPFG
jgi:hypothetical protein